MRSLSLGPLRVSELGIGCWTFGRTLSFPQVQSIVDAALEAGVTLFDTADRYGSGSDADYRPGLDHQIGKGKSEEFLGAALGAARNQVVIASKFGAGRGRGHRTEDGRRDNDGGGEPEYVLRCLEQSLDRLGVDHIDLYQMHEPDLVTPIDETVDVLGQLVRAGRIRAYGCCNFSGVGLAGMCEAADRLGAPRPVSVQNHYSLLHRQPEAEVVPVCLAYGVKILPYFPLASGVLSGKYRLGIPFGVDTRLGVLAREGRPEKIDRFFNRSFQALIESLEAFAAEHRRALIELALSWLCAQPTVAAVIPGVSRPAQVLENARAVGWKLSDVELQAVRALLDVPPPVPPEPATSVGAEAEVP